MGIEYSLLIVQEPILYVIRKVHRHSPEKGESRVVCVCACVRACVRVCVCELRLK